jgi:dihydroorotate dehydrogenase (fumarate)
MNIDYSTDYLGLKLDTPLVASAGPITASLENLERLQELGISAAVLPSLFAEQIEHEELAINDFYDDLKAAHRECESSAYFPEMDLYNAGRNKYLQHLSDAKQRVSIPIIASLNCRGPGQWMQEAKRLEDAGADALEINIYDVVTDPAIDVTEVEAGQLEVIETVRRQVSIPLAVKLCPYYTALPNFARRLADAGANGLVLFNRYLEPEIDLNELAVQPHLDLSRPGELRLPLRWIAILRDTLSISLGATSGVHSSTDVIKALLVGADAVMFTSALLKYGIEHVEPVFFGLKQWMEDREYDSVRQLQGSMSRQKCADPTGFERANYIKAIVSYR